MASPRSPQQAQWLWPVTLALPILAALLAFAAATGAAAWLPVAAGVTALVCAVAVAAVRYEHGATVQALEQRERASKQREAEFQHHVQQRNLQWNNHLAARATALDEAVKHLVTERIPAVGNDTPVPPPYQNGALDEEVAARLEDVLDTVADSAKQDRERQESLRLAVVALARRVQTSAHRIQETVSLMAERHPGNPDVLEASMQVDHAAAQQGRHAQSLAVLCGDWPGQQWPKPLALVDVVRAAASRIVAYKRVEVSGDPDTAASAKVVEPLIHLVAELLANATQSSPPATTVLVAIRNVQRGAVIEIDDGGVGMDEHHLEQAREVVSGRRTVGVGEVGEIPQTGLAVIGHYVRRHGFLADLLPSPYGGVRAVVLVPTDVVETLEPVSAPPVRAARPAVPEERAPHAAPQDPELPRRRSKRGEAAPSAEGTAGGPFTAAEGDGEEGAPADQPAPERTETTPEQAGAWMAAFFDHNADTEPGDDGE
ncbi:ATP-binding protein [Nonomuraea endophytica]|uniref:histidine kinase n=1 Tax=Nonomuraea endophytica TaxID=714136 RepID=A0A7W8EGJ4_9ACTN|nr:ATP-binding protein [Nonomuraea endophytica]MBB5078446.1 signal transduction histidine kinase [Nonomuraea endophytica]